MSTDFVAIERAAANKAAKSIQSNIRSQHQSIFKKHTGALAKTRVTPKYRKQSLDRLVITAPRYAYQLHFGSEKTGQTKSFSRKAARVSSFVRKTKNGKTRVSSFNRIGSTVKSHDKNRKYKAYRNVSRALIKSTPSLNELANTLSNNRSIQIVSLINF